MRTLPVHLCAAMAVFATMAWGQEEGSDTGVSSDAALAAKLEEVAANPAVTPEPVVVPAITSSAPAAAPTDAAAPTTPTVVMTDEPAIEPGPEVHIGTGSVAWNAQLRESDATRALQEARARRDLYRNIALAGSPVPVQRTAAEFLAANPPVIQAVDDIPEGQGSGNLLEVRASGAPRISDVPEFNNTPPPRSQQQQLPRSRPKSNFLSFLKPKEKVEATAADFQNPYAAPNSYPDSEPSFAEAPAPEPASSPEEQARMDSFIAEATVGGPPASGSDAPNGGGNVLKKLFGKKTSPDPASVPNGSLPPATFAANPPTPPSAGPPIPSVPEVSTGEPDLTIPSPPSVNAPEPTMPAPTAATPPPAPTEPSQSIFRKEEPKPAIFRTE